MLGAPHAARAVGWVLHYCDTDAVPWHRVISSQGRISTTCADHPGFLQKALLQSEGVKVGKDFTIDLQLYQWQPPSYLVS